MAGSLKVHTTPDGRTFFRFYPGDNVMWFKGGNWHRDYGPAHDFANGRKIWWEKGSQIWPKL